MPKLLLCSVSKSAFNSHKMVDSLEIIKGSFFKNKKGKVVEIYGFTVENEKLSIWTRESYLNSKNEIQHHQELYFIEDINHIEVDNDWSIRSSYRTVLLVLLYTADKLYLHDLAYSSFHN